MGAMVRVFNRHDLQKSLSQRAAAFDVLTILGCIIG